MNIGVIIQARMGSSRRPGKVLHPIAGQPMLQLLLQRLERCSGLRDVVVATSDTPSDDPVEEFCQQTGVTCRRGSLHNVASRFNDILTEFSWNYFVRLCGDSPLLDQEIVRQAIYIARPPVDLVTNVKPRTFPRGQSVEVIRTAVFQDAFPEMSLADDLEHVTPYLYRNTEALHVQSFTAKRDYSHIHLAVDTPRHMEIVEGMVSSMKKPHWHYGWEELISLYRQQRETNGKRAA